mmetsp:Transcript_12864/g.19535  ORF Transcript_12864/g.19535 Transcript_12864/m.19535 type:complete len:422 (+) Transcript_12864:18-1283(+)
MSDTITSHPRPTYSISPRLYVMRTFLLLLLLQSLLLLPLPTHSMSKVPKTLPKNLIVGYTTSKADTLASLEKVTEAIQNGVNVVIWSFIHLTTTTTTTKTTKTTKPVIQGGPNLTNLETYIQKLHQMGYEDTIHLAAFGGWNGPHLDTTFSPEDMYQAWVEYNTNNKVFDGFDWDLEGQDDVNGPNNVFTLEVLQAMGEMSRLAKLDGCLVSMAPAQSYLDMSTCNFSRRVNLTPHEPDWHPEFPYHGANVYAYLLAKWGAYMDFICVQFYEGYSHANYQITRRNAAPSTYVYDYVMQLKHQGQGYFVNFENDPDLEMSNTTNQFVNVPMDKLVIGLANGWAVGSDKFLYMDPRDVGVAYARLLEDDLDASSSPPFRGFMFWVIEEEGTNDVHLASALNDILGDGSISSAGNKSSSIIIDG